MPERKTIGIISVITDCDTGMYTIGEIDGGLDREMTRQHILKYGSEALLTNLAHMTHMVIEEQRSINLNDKGVQGEATTLNPGVALPELSGTEKVCQGVAESHLKPVS